MAAGTMRMGYPQRPGLRDQPAFLWLNEAGDVERTISYGEVEACSLHLAAVMLNKWRLQPGDRVMLVYPPGLDFIVAMHACLNAGVVAVPVYPPLPHRIARDVKAFSNLVQSAGAKIVLTTRAYKLTATMLSYKAKWPSGMTWHATDKVAQSVPKKFAPQQMPARQGDDVAYLQFTSGSTSAPKGVVLTYSNLTSHLDFITNIARINMDRLATPERPANYEDAPFLNWAPFYHDLGLVGACFFGWTNGWKTYLMSPATFMKNPVLLMEAISKHRIVFTSGTDSAYAMVLKRWQATPTERRPQLDLTCLATALNCAEPVRASIVRQFQETFEPLGLHRGVNMPAFGMAENVCGITVSVEGLYVDSKGGVACGLITTDPHTEVRIVDPSTCQECPEGCGGEVWADSPSKCAGYWGQPEVSESVFRARLQGSTDTGGRTYLRTGDKGYILEGRLYICGRIKDMLIIGGRNVYPQDIEWSVQEEFSAVRKGCIAVFALPSASGDPDDSHVGLVAEVYACSPAEAAALARSMAQHVEQEFSLSVSKVALIEPRRINKTTSGKIQRFACREAMVRGTLKVAPGGAYVKGDSSGDASAYSGKSSLSSDLADLKELDGEAAEYPARAGQPAGRASTVEEVFRKHGITNLSIDVPANGVPSVQLHVLMGELERVSGCKVDIETLTQQPAGVVRDLCRRSITARRSWRLAAGAAQLSVLSTQLSTGAAVSIGAGFDGLGLQQAGIREPAGMHSGGDSAAELASCPRRSSAAANWRRAASLALRSLLGDSLKQLQAFQGLPPISKRAPTLQRPSAAATPADRPLAAPLQLALQLLGAFFVLSMAAAAVFPAYYYARWVRTLPAPWGHLWQDPEGTRLRVGGLLMPLTVALWMVSLTLQLLAAKWVVVGRYRPGCWAMWGPAFVRWWLLDRFMAFWEVWVGRFLVDTWWLSIFYRLMGASISPFAAMKKFIREPDLVTVGPGATVDGDIYCRVLLPSKLYLDKVTIGPHCELRDLSVVQPGCVLEEGAVLEHSAVAPEAMHAASCTFYSGNPAQASGALPRPSLNPLPVAAREVAKALTLLPGILYLCYYAGALVVFLWSAGGDVPHFRYGPVLFWTTYYFMAWAAMGVVGILAKWVLLGRRRPGVVQNGWCRQWLRYFVNSSSTFYRQGTSILCRGTILHNLYMRLLGMRISVWSSMVAHAQLAPAADADYLSVGPGAFINRSAVAVSRPAPGGKTEYMAAQFKRGSTMGQYSSIGPGKATVGKGAVVAINSRCTREVPEGCSVLGNPAYVVGQAHSKKGREQFNSDTGSAGSFILWRLFQLALRALLVALMVLAPILPAYELLAYLFFGGTTFWWSRSYSAPVAAPLAIFLVSGVLAVWMCGTLLMYWAISLALQCYVSLVLGNPDSIPLTSLSFQLYSDIQIIMYLHTHEVALQLLYGTKLLVWYQRALGATVGSGAYLNIFLYDPHLVTVAEEAVVDVNSVMAGHKVERGSLLLGPSRLGPRATLMPFASCHMMEEELSAPGLCLAPLSCCLRGAQVGEEEYWVGVPAKKAAVKEVV